MAPKPLELRELSETTRRLFDILKQQFRVGDSFTFSLNDVEAPNALRDFKEVAAFSLRKIQALHHTTRPGVRTAADVIIELVAGLNRSLPELAGQVDHPQVHKEILALTDKIVRAGIAVSDVPPDENNSGQVAHLE